MLRLIIIIMIPVYLFTLFYHKAESGENLFCKLHCYSYSDKRVIFH